MILKQEILVSVLGLFLFTGLASASETRQGHETRPDVEVSSPTAMPNEFAGELRTSDIHTVKNSEKTEQSKVDLAKAMIGKFRINGI